MSNYWQHVKPQHLARHSQNLAQIRSAETSIPYIKKKIRDHFESYDAHCMSKRVKGALTLQIRSLLL